MSFFKVSVYLCMFIFMMLELKLTHQFYENPDYNLTRLLLAHVICMIGLAMATLMVLTCDKWRAIGQPDCEKCEVEATYEFYDDNLKDMAAYVNMEKDDDGDVVIFPCPCGLPESKCTMV